MGNVATGGNINVGGLHCQWGHGDVQAHAATESLVWVHELIATGSVLMCGLCYHWRPWGCLWSVQSGNHDATKSHVWVHVLTATCSVLMSVAGIAIKSQRDVHGLYCRTKSCGFPWSYLHLALSGSVTLPQQGVLLVNSADTRNHVQTHNPCSHGCNEQIRCFGSIKVIKTADAWLRQRHLKDFCQNPYDYLNLPPPKSNSLNKKP